MRFGVPVLFFRIDSDVASNLFWTAMKFTMIITFHIHKLPRTEIILNNTRPVAKLQLYLIANQPEIFIYSKAVTRKKKMKNFTTG